MHYKYQKQLHSACELKIYNASNHPGNHALASALKKFFRREPNDSRIPLLEK